MTMAQAKDEFRAVSNIFMSTNGVSSMSKYGQDLLQLFSAPTDYEKGRGVRVLDIKFQNFKNLNTIGGHEFGDEALAETALAIQSALQKELAGTGVEVKGVYTAGPSYKAVILNDQAASSQSTKIVETALNKIFVDEKSQFRTDTVNNIKKNSGLAAAIKGKFTAKDFNYTFKF